jgi:putative NADH-flavin reductase
MARLIILGATGSLGHHALGQALAAGHQVTAIVRKPARLPPDARPRVAIHTGDLNALGPADLAGLVGGHDALINCAGHVADGAGFVQLFDRLVTAVESLPLAAQPVCWFVAGAALLDIGTSGRRGVDLPRVRSTYWPHRVNFDRLSRSALDWRLLCPGPMVDRAALGLDRLRTALDRLPVHIPGFARFLPGPLLLPLFARRIGELTVPYADAARLMVDNLERGDAMARHRVGLALPVGMRDRKPQPTAAWPQPEGARRAVE